MKILREEASISPTMPHPFLACAALALVGPSALIGMRPRLARSPIITALAAADADLDAQLDALTQKLEILQLKAQLAELQRSTAAATSAEATTMVRAAAPRKRVLMMVGGDLDDYNREIFELIISNAGGPTSTLCVIATNGEDPCCDPDSSWVFYQQLFTGYGATDVKYINIDVNNSFPGSHTGNAYDPAIIEQIMALDSWG